MPESDWYQGSVALKRFTKDPDAVLDYTFDYADWLAEGDTIASVESTADAGLDVDSTSHTPTTATVWISGGTAGSTYDVVTHVTTADGREDDCTISITVREH